MTSALFSPYKINGLELANRINVAPMCQYSATDGVIGDWHMTHLGMLANSGAGLVFVEMTDVERRGRITHGCVGIYSDDCEAAFTRIIAHCKRIGTAKFGIQIAHAGRKASSARPWEGGLGLKPDQDPWETIGPSAIPFGANWPAPRQMTEEDIATGARRLRRRRQARAAHRLRCDPVAHGARLSDPCVHLSDLQPAQRFLWRRSRTAA